MKHSQRDTVHRVRAVRYWLEKAEASFDEESDIKGELNLMLAEAEMKNLRKHHPVSRNWLRAGAMVTAFFLALGGWYAFRLTGQEERPPAVEAVVQDTAAGNEAGQDPVDTGCVCGRTGSGRQRAASCPGRNRAGGNICAASNPCRRRTACAASRDGCSRTGTASSGSGTGGKEGSLVGPPGTSYCTRSTSYLARYRYYEIDNGGFL